MVRGKYLKEGKFVDLWTVPHFVTPFVAAWFMLPLGVSSEFLFLLVVLWEIFEHPLNGGVNILGWPVRTYEGKVNAVVDIIVGGLGILLAGYFLGI